jgi:hypothetical protein
MGRDMPRNGMTLYVNLTLSSLNTMAVLFTGAISVGSWFSYPKMIGT